MKKSNKKRALLIALLVASVTGLVAIENIDNKVFIADCTTCCAHIPQL